MGKMMTKGVAKRVVEYDAMTINVLFEAREGQTKDAVRKVLEESEEFLKIIKDAGVDMELVEAGRDEVEKGRYSNEKYVEAIRWITIRTAYDTVLSDFIMRLSENRSYSLSLDIRPEITDAADIHKELLLEAVKDARETADMIAETAGVRIKGIKKINVGGDIPYRNMLMEKTDSGKYDIPMFLETGLGAGETAKPRLFTKLKSATSSEEETVYVQWIIEDK